MKISCMFYLNNYILCQSLIFLLLYEIVTVLECVLLNCSEVIQYLVGDCMVEGTEGTNELVLGKLREVFSRAQKDGNARLQETVLLTIAQLGRYVPMSVVYRSIIKLTYYRTNHSCRQTVAQEEFVIYVKCDFLNVRTISLI